MRSASWGRQPVSPVSMVLRFGLVGAVVFLIWSTTADTEPLTAGIWDKGLHFLAFYFLSVLSAVAFPRIGVPVLFVGMTALGVGIEALQALPFVPHDPSWNDAIADMGGAAAGLGPIFVDRLRRRLSASRAPTRKASRQA